MMWISLSGIPAARNWAARSSATRWVSPRLCPEGISIACLNSSRVFACQVGSSLVGTVRGSVAAAATPGRAAMRAKARRRFILRTLLFAGELAQHDLPVDDIVVQRLDRQPLVLAVRAIVDRRHGPAAIG